MKKSVRATLVFGTIFCALLIWYLFYEQKYRPQKKEKEEKAKNLISFLSEEIKELEIEWSKEKGQKIKIKKFGENWRILEPFEDESDNSTIKSMISTLTNTKVERTVEDEAKNLTVYGLDAPTIKIKIKTEDKESKILLGKDTPVGYNSYLQIEGSKKVVIVSKSLKNTFDKKISDLRNKKILSLAQHEVNEVEINTPKENIVFKKEKNDTWLLAKTNIPVDSTKWNNTFNAIMDLKATNFIDGKEKNLASFGLLNPFAKIYISDTKKKKKEVLLLGKTKEKYYAKASEKKVIYEINKDLFDKILKPSTDYQSKKIARFDRFSVKKIKLERSNEPLMFEKKNSDWIIPTEPNLKINPSKVEDFLTALQDTKVDKFLNYDKEIKSSDLIIQLFEKDKEIFTISLKQDGQKYLGKNSNYPVSFLLSKTEFEKLNAPKNKFVEKEEKKENKAVN